MIKIATVAELLVRIGGDSSGLRREINNSQRQLRRAFGPEALELSEGAAGILAAIAVGMGAVGLASIKMSSDFAVAKTAFTKLLGSAEKADVMLKDLATFAADTPFEMPGLINASKKLLAYQFAAQDIIPIMAAVGDAVGLMGGGQEAIDGIVRALGQIQMKGKLSAEEVNQLAERNVNAWKYVAAELGVSIPQAMKMTEQGAVDATTAINGIVKGMQSEFKGGMAGLSKEIPGLLSTMKDNVGAVMREIGDQITGALDLKNKLQGAVNYLNTFASVVQSSGIKNAILGLVPPEAIAAVFALGGALVAVALPALFMFIGALGLAIAPMAGYIALGTAIGLLAYEVWKNWEPLSELFSTLWSSLQASAALYLNNLQTNFYTAISYIMKLLVPLANLFGGSMAVTVNGWASNVGDKLQILGDESGTLKSKLQSNFSDMGDSVKKFNVGLKNIDIAGLIPSDSNKPNTIFTGLSGSTQQPLAGLGDSGGGSSGSLDQAAKEWEKLESKAKQVSDSIEREWVQTTKTQLEQLDVWQAEQISSLDETKSANENYERDKERIAAVYSTRRTKIIQTEAKDAIDTFKSIRDGYESIQRGMSGLTGSAKGVDDINVNYDDKIKAAKDYFDKITQDYDVATDAQKKNITDSLNKEKVAYQISADGKLNLDKATADASAAYQKQKLTDLTNYYATNKDIQADIDAAYNANSMTKLQEALTAENAIRMNDYAAQKSMMDTYQEVYLAAHSTTAQLVSGLYTNAFSGLSSSISEVLQGTSSINDAFTSLGQTMLKVVADYVAKWMAGRLMMAIFGKTTAAAEAATSMAAGVATAAAWAPAAAMVSLATFGANSAPAMAGIGATVALSSGLAIAGFANGGLISGPGTGTSDSILARLSHREFVMKASAVDKWGVGTLNAMNAGKMPAYATGGLVTGASLSSVGSSRYANASLAGNKSISDTNKSTTASSAGDQYHFEISGIDGPSIRKMILSEGATIVKSLKNQAKGFNTAGVSLT